MTHHQWGVKQEKFTWSPSSQLGFKKSEIVSNGPFIKTINIWHRNDPQVHTLDWNLQDLVVMKYFTWSACSWTCCRIWTMAMHSEAFGGDKHMRTQSELRSCAVKDKASVKQNLWEWYMCSADSHFHPFNSVLLFHHRCNEQLNECTKMHHSYIVVEILSSPLIQGVATNLRHPVGLFIFQIPVNTTDHTYTGR